MSALLLDDQEVCAVLTAIAQGTEPDQLDATQAKVWEKVIAAAAKEGYYCAWQPQRHCLDLKTGNKIASSVLDRLADGESGEDGILESDVFYEYGAYEDARILAEKWAEKHLDPDEVTIGECKNLIGELTRPIADALQDNDTSRPRDILSTHDTAEVVFVFVHPGMKYPLDASICSTRPWSEFQSLVIDDNLAHAMSCLGYTIGEYRKASRNSRQADLARDKMKLGDTRKARSNPPICSMEHIEEMVDNACATNFLFCLYAIVPIVDLLDLDLKKPLTFSNAAVATYNPWSGTFHDTTRVPNVTVTPNQGRLVSVNGWYTPDGICGLVHTPYKARLSQNHVT